MSEIRKSILTSTGELVGVAIAIVIVLTIAAMGIISAQTSANMVSATTQIAAFLSLIGLAVGLAAFLRVLGKI